MEDDTVGGQVVIFDALALLVPVIGGDHIATKRDPVLKSVERVIASIARKPPLRV